MKTDWDTSLPALNDEESGYVRTIFLNKVRIGVHWLRTNIVELFVRPTLLGPMLAEDLHKWMMESGDPKAHKTKYLIVDEEGNILIEVKRK